MAETTVYYDNGGGTPSIVRYSGRLDTSTIRSSTDITGLPALVEGIGIDDDHYALGDNSGDKLWYMSGHYTSTVKNSVAQGTISGSILSISLNDSNTACKANMTGSIALALFSGKITSTIKATWDPTNQSIYQGTSAPSCLTLIRADATDKPIFYVPNATGGPIYIRLSSIFGTVLGDIEEAPSVFGVVSADFMTYTGSRFLWADSAAAGKVGQTFYFQPIFVNLSAIANPAWVTAGGKDDIDSDTLQERLFATHNESLFHDITLSHVVELPVTHQKFLTQFLAIEQTVLGGVFNVPHELLITQEVTRDGSTYNRSLSHNVDFTDSAGINAITSASSSLTFSHTVSLHFQESESHTLTFSQVVTNAVFDGDLINDLTFGQTVTKVVEATIEASNSLTFGHVLAFYVEGVSICTYDPQPPRDLEFPISTRATVTLQDNLSSPVNTIDIRRPGLGNTESIEVFRALNESRSRNRAIYRDSDWPINRVLKIVSSENTQAEAETFLDFLSATLGEKIKLIDWEDRTWIGIILNPDTVVKDFGICRYQFEIEFLGDLTETTTGGEDTFNRSLDHNLFLSDELYKLKLCPNFQVQCPDFADVGFPPSGEG